MLPITDNMPALTGDTEGQRPIANNGVESTGGGPFGDILNAQGGAPAADPGADGGQEPPMNGGNNMQPGGKDLPATPMTEPKQAASPSYDPETAATAELPAIGALPPVATLGIDNSTPLPEDVAVDGTRSLAAATGSSATNANPINATAGVGQTQIVSGGQQPGAAAGQPAIGIVGEGASELMGQAASGQAASGQAASGQAASGQAASGQAATAVSSKEASALTDQSANVMAGQLAAATTGQPAGEASAAKPVSVRSATTAIAGSVADDNSALSTLTAADSGREGIVRDSAASPGRTLQLGAQEATRLTGPAEPAPRLDLSALDRASAVAKEGALLDTADPGKGVELTQVKAPAAAQTQAVAAGIPMPTGLSELSAAPKTGALASMTTPLGDPNWEGEFSGRVSLLVKNGMPEAKLQLSPPDLGRVDIRIMTDGDQARVQFAVHSIDARDAIEQAMPRLREMLEQSGLQLARSEVADYSQSNQGERPAFGADAGSYTADTEEEPVRSLREFAVSASSSTVDYYV